MKTYVTTTKLDSFELKYFKTTTQGEHEGEESSFYGVSVEKHVDDKLVEGTDSGPVCEDDTQITKIISLLAENYVTPFALFEVLDEMECLHQ